MGLGGHLLQHPDEAVDDSRDVFVRVPSSVEEDVDSELVAQVFHGEGEVVIRLFLGGDELKARELSGLLPHEVVLESVERVYRDVAAGPEHLDQGAVVVAGGVDGLLLCLMHQLGEGAGASHPDPGGDRVDEQTECLLDTGERDVTAGDDLAEDDIVAAGQVCHHDAPRRLDHAAHGDLVRCCSMRDRLAEGILGDALDSAGFTEGAVRCVAREHPVAAPVAVEDACPVGVKLHGVTVAQFVDVVLPGRSPTTFGEVALPYESETLAAQTLVEIGELPAQLRHRPPVKNDVVVGEDDALRRVGQVEHIAADEGIGAQIEESVKLGGILPSHALGLFLGGEVTQVDDPGFDAPIREDDLMGPTEVFPHNRGAQQRVALGDELKHLSDSPGIRYGSEVVARLNTVAGGRLVAEPFE